MMQELQKISVIPQDDAPMSSVPALTQYMTPMSMLDRAIASGASIEVLDKLMGLQERYEANLARKAFDNAMADAVFPIIKKDCLVDYASTKSPTGRVTYKHEDLASVLRAVVPVLNANGLSHRFRVTSNVNEPVTVTCIISHRDGYFEETTLCAAKDDTGGKNPIQQVGSTLTYLQRMSLKAALGLAASTDDDGRAAEPASEATAAEAEPAPGSITEAQADAITDLLESRDVSRVAFLQWAKQKRVVDIPAAHFDSCIAAISNFKPKAVK